MYEFDSGYRFDSSGVFGAFRSLDVLQFQFWIGVMSNLMSESQVHIDIQIVINVRLGRESAWSQD